MSRVLHAPHLDAAPHAMASPAAALDAVARAAVEEAEAAAYARGRRDGITAAQQAADEALARAVDAVRPALASLTDEVRGLRAERATADVSCALAIAEAVLGREPTADAVALASRLRDVLGHLDDPAPAIHVHPDDAPTVTALLADVPGAPTVTADTTVTAGEARVVGTFARATISRAAALDAVRDALLGDDGDPEGEPDDV